MAATIYIVKLSPDERDALTKIIAEGKESDRTIMRARILLLSDYSVEKKVMSNAKLANLLGSSHTTIQDVRTKYAKEGFESAIYRKKVENRARKLDEDAIRKIVELTKKEPPEGKKRWSLRTLCKECEMQGIVSHVAPSTMSAVLNEVNIKL